MKEGSYVSIDLDTKKLKIYFSDKNPNRAYEIIKNLFIENGFEHLKDTNYSNYFLTPEESSIIIKKFSEKEKWFPVCVNKVNIMPLRKSWDITKDIINDYIDIDFIKQKEIEYNNKKNIKEIKNNRPSLLYCIKSQIMIFSFITIKKLCPKKNRLKFFRAYTV